MAATKKTAFRNKLDGQKKNLQNVYNECNIQILIKIE